MLSGGRPRDGERRRTVVVSGVPGVLPDGRMADKLTVHFQRVRRSHGGDVEGVTYPTGMDGVAFVTFHSAEDADRVARKECHVMKDDELPEEYALTVFRFSADVFLYVSSATVDLSVFGGDQAPLIESLRSAHRSIRFRPFPEQREALVEGPLSAVKALREDLADRAERLKNSVQTAAVKPKDPRSSLRVGSRPEIVGSVGFSGAKAKQKPSRPSGSLKLRQDTGEGRDSVSKTQAASLTPSVSGGRLRHVTGEESNAGTVSASGPELNSIEEKSAGQPRKGASLENRRRSGRISDATAGGGSHPDLGSTAAYGHVCRAELREASAEGMEDPSPEGGQVIWVDSDTFRYIETLHKKELDRCVKDVNMLINGVEGSGLLKILLTENKTSGSRYLETALDELQTLIQLWMALLTVHQILYDKLLTEQELTSICDAVSARYKDVLYTFEDSRIKVIGPTAPCHLFRLKVEDMMFILRQYKIKKSLEGKNKNKGMQFHY